MSTAGNQTHRPQVPGGESALPQEEIMDTLRLVEYNNLLGLLFTDVGGRLQLVHEEPNGNPRVEYGKYNNNTRQNYPL